MATAAESTTSILVVDDEPVNLQILEKILEREGYRVMKAHDGVEGMELLTRHVREISLILLDRMMPNMDGMEFMRKLKADRRLSHVPVIMQTAAAADRQIAEGISAGVFYYLIKPFSEDVLLSVVTAALKDLGRYRELLRAFDDYEHRFNSMTQCTLELRHIDEVESAALFFASFFPDPDVSIYGISELIFNAIEHGNLEIGYRLKSQLVEAGNWMEEIRSRLESSPFRDRRVTVSFERNVECVKLQIADQGQGFDLRNYLELSPERATHNHGRGIAIACLQSFDHVEYIAPGNRVICRCNY